ncbi:hypothetical protein IJJ08_00060 [bacterium]|nr:hypothetical protein [bacterium]
MTSEQTKPSQRHRSTRLELAQMEKQLLILIDKGDNTIGQLIEKTGWSRQNINRRLAVMLKDQRLQMVYRGRSTYYRLQN